MPSSGDLLDPGAELCLLSPALQVEPSLLAPAGKPSSLSSRVFPRRHENLDGIHVSQRSSWSS